MTKKKFSAGLWADYNRRTTTRWQRFKEWFEDFDHRLENFCAWYWPYFFLAAGALSVAWLAVFISLQPNGWYHVGYSLTETFLGW